MSVTIQHIADQVGVSKQAVSYALNGKTGQVSPATAQRIMSAAKELGYQRNWRARSFALKRSQTIGLVYGRPADYVERSQIVSTLVEQLAALDHELMLIPALGPMEQWAHKLSDGRVDGALITHPMPLGLDRFVAERRLPAVFLNLRSELDVPQIQLDDADGARQIMAHLLELGHRRITYYCSPKRHGEHYSALERQHTYASAMVDAGLAQHVELAFTSYATFAADLAGRSPADRPTAVMAYSDLDAVQLAQALWSHGMCVPRDLSLTGFNDEPAARDMIPPLTTAAAPVGELVRQALTLLLDPAGDPAVASPVLLRPRLIARASTTPPPDPNRP